MSYGTTCYNPCVQSYPCHNTHQEIEKIISIPFDFYQAQLGHYFYGETPLLTQTSGYAISALVNPVTSNSYVYVNVMTMSNSSQNIATVTFYIGSTLPTPGIVSPLVANGNQALTQIPSPNAQVQYLTNSIAPVGGVPAFSRLAPVGQTLVDEKGGRIILAPGQSMIMAVSGLVGTLAFAWGWWEKPINHRC